MRSEGAFDRLDVLADRPIGWRDGVAAAEEASATPARTRLQVLRPPLAANGCPTTS